MGGLSIWKGIHDALPGESLIFFGDGARCPYGDKAPEIIREYTREAVDILLSKGAKLIVVACNTATAVAIDFLRETYPEIPFVGLEPAIKPATISSQTKVVGVVATKRSLEGKLYKHTAELCRKEVKILESVGEGWVESVEQNEESSPETLEKIIRVTEPMVRAGVDRIVLGCTHYPFLKEQIRSLLPDGVEIVDSTEAVARRVKQLLSKYELYSEEGHVPSFEFLTCSDEQYAGKLRNKVIY